VAGFGGVIVGSLITWGVQARLLGRRIKADEAIAERKFDFDKDLAERRFKYDRALHDRRRLTELAEEVLSDFYHAREIVHGARSRTTDGFHFGEEEITRKRNKQPWETEADTRLLNS